jgi:hypothetical protein
LEVSRALHLQPVAVQFRVVGFDWQSLPTVIR